MINGPISSTHLVLTYQLSKITIPRITASANAYSLLLNVTEIPCSLTQPPRRRHMLF